MKFEPPCDHREGRFRCCAIPVNVLYRAKRAVLAKPKKEEQDKRLSFLMKVKSPRRRRVRGETPKNNPTSITVNYHILRSGKEVIPVCANFFRKLFGIGVSRIMTIAKGIQSGKGVQDKRGGDHKVGKFQAKRQKVTEFLSKLRAGESHYSRNKSKRLYLSSTLSIRKLFIMYNNSVPDNLKVKKSFFTKNFTTKFNLGFGTPASDTCSYCLRLHHEIKIAFDKINKQELITELRIHKIRAKQFHKLLKEEPYGSKTFVFDMQQVQVLPKLSIGEAYYSRKISHYSLCVTDVETKDPTFYLWTEMQAGRGSEEVASVITNFLSSSQLDSSTTTIRLFADGCGGQNKNQHVMHALAFWLLKEAPPHVTEISVFFPVRGHSFLPADRVFGRVEKELMKIPEIFNPTDYEKVYRSVGNTRVLGRDWVVKDYKELTQILKKNYGISDLKRITLKKCGTEDKRDVKIKTEVTYRFEDPSNSFRSMTKRGKRFFRDAKERNNLGLVNHISEEKREDVKKLLATRFGENWEEVDELQFFKESLSLPSISLQESDESHVMCNCLEEDCPLI